MNKLALRNFTFGVEDSLASTVGLLSGIASAQVRPQTIIITGLILIFTEAMSMGIGSFLSDQSAEKSPRTSFHRSLSGGIIMFVSYLVAGVIPLFPYAVFSNPLSLYLSIAFSLLALFILGLYTRQAWRMMILGGVVIVGSVAVGHFLKPFTT